MRFGARLVHQLVLLAFGRNPHRYLRLRPACSRTQVLVNLHTRKRLNFDIRDTVDYTVLNQVFVNEEYDVARLPQHQSLIETYRRMVEARQTPLILDCGANIGMAAAYFTDRFPEARVIAVEPEKGNFDLATRNCRHRNVDLIHAAIASENTSGSLIDPGFGGWSYRVQTGAAPAAEGIRMISIDSLLMDPAYQHCQPFIVKIDIEGFEEELFSKNTDWVDKFPLLIIELHDWMLPGQGSSRPFLSTISRLNRDFVYIGENVFSLVHQPNSA